MIHSFQENKKSTGGNCLYVTEKDDIDFGEHLSRLMTKPTKLHVRPAKAQISLAGRSHSLIRVFTVRMKKAWVLSYPLNAQRRLWSDWEDAEADPSLRWAHRSFCWFYHEAARLFQGNYRTFCASWEAYGTRFTECMAQGLEWMNEWIPRDNQYDYSMMRLKLNGLCACKLCERYRYRVWPC